uniref:Uncharacterized protein n=1 Tax=Rhizophora mucronata TaxID=61149 RepID=A0A2P2PD43_RHIMU
MIRIVLSVSTLIYRVFFFSPFLFILIFFAHLKFSFQLLVLKF